MLISLRACAVDAIDRENYIQLCVCVGGETQSPVKNKGYTWVAQHVRLETCNPVQRLMNHGARRMLSELCTQVAAAQANHERGGGERKRRKHKWGALYKQLLLFLSFLTTEPTTKRHSAPFFDSDHSCVCSSPFENFQIGHLHFRIVL